MAIGIREHNWRREGEKTYDVFFYEDSIFTTVTFYPITVSQWISYVTYLHRDSILRLVVGLDVEWRPSFTRGVQNPVATLQLCVGNRCLIYQILRSHDCFYIPQSLADFLADRDNIFVGVGVKSDLDKLQNYYGIGGDSRYVELGMLAAEAYNRVDLKSAGLKTLASLVLGKEVEKPQAVRTSGWDNWRLTAEQVQYACVDAFVSFDIGWILDAPFYRSE